eukprot:tig00000654_g2818.t1
MTAARGRSKVIADFNATTLVTNGMITAVYHELLGGGRIGRANVTVIDAVARCNATRIAVSAILECASEPVPGSGALRISDVAFSGSSVPDGRFFKPLGVPILRSGAVVLVAVGREPAPAVPLEVGWTESVGGGILIETLVDVVGASVSCPERVREGVDILCVLSPAPGGPVLELTDLLPGEVLPAGSGEALPLAPHEQQPGNVSLGILNVSLHLGGVNVSVRYNLSIHAASPNIAQSPFTVDVVAAVLTINASRAVAGAPVGVTLVRKSGSESLLSTDFEGPWFLNATASSDGSPPQLSALVPLAATGNALTFYVKPTTVGEAQLLWANYSGGVGGGLVNEVNVTVVEATVACAPLRVVIGAAITCNVSRTAASPALVASDLTLSVSPPTAGAVGQLTAVSGQPHQFEFTFVPSEPVLGSINVRYAPHVDPSTQHVGGSPVPFTSLNATLSCETLRFLVGAGTVCSATKHTAGGDLFPADFVMLGSPAGVAGDIGLHPSLNGSLSFNFTVTTSTGPSGESLQVIRCH